MPLILVEKPVIRNRLLDILATKYNEKIFISGSSHIIGYYEIISLFGSENLDSFFYQLSQKIKNSGCTIGIITSIHQIYALRIINKFSECGLDISYFNVFDSLEQNIESSIFNDIDTIIKAIENEQELKKIDFELLDVGCKSAPDTIEELLESLKFHVDLLTYKSFYKDINNGKKYNINFRELFASKAACYFSGELESLTYLY